MTVIDIADLQMRLRQFALPRNWGRFHNPKNLTMALSVEVAELVEIYQWLTPEEASASTDESLTTAVADEMADIFLYLAQLADVTGVDLVAAVEAEVRKNEVKHPPV